MKTLKSELTPKQTLETLHGHVRKRNERLEVKHPIIPGAEGAQTQQQFKDDCDMNRIVKNASRGIAPRFLNPNMPQYGDFSETKDLMSAYSTIRDAEEAFMNLPSGLRLELGNDPARLSELTQDQLERYNLVKPTLQPADPVPTGGQPANTIHAEAPLEQKQIDKPKKHTQ